MSKSEFYFKAICPALVLRQDYFVLSKVFPFLFFFIFSSSLTAQYLPYTIVVKTQAEVDSIPIKYGTFTHLGGLIVGHATPWSTLLTDIRDLSVLEDVVWIENGVKIINNPLLKNLHGLHNIDTIGYYGLQIKNNDSLINLQGFNTLRHVGDYELDGEPIRIEDNDNLKYLSLNNIKKINWLVLDNNPMLESCSFDSLKQIEEVFQLTKNNIHTLNFPRLSYIGDLSINGEKQLENLSPFSNLDSIRGEIRIWENLNLKSLNGLQNLPHHVEHFLVENNPQLEELVVFNNKPTPYGALSPASYKVSSNPKLKFIQFDSTELISWIEIQDNKSLKTISFGSCEQAGREPDLFNNSPIYINQNDSLRLINMPSLKRVTHQMIINGNERLEEAYFENLDSVYHKIDYSDGAFLKQLGFQKLAHVGLRGMSVGGKMFSLKDFSGLSNMKYARWLSLTAHSNTSFDGLDSLAKVGVLDINGADDYLQYGQPSKLEFIKKFPALDSIGILPKDTLQFSPLLMVRGFKFIDTLADFLDVGYISPETCLRVYGCASLQSVVYPKRFEELHAISIGENPSLTELDFSAIKKMNVSQQSTWTNRIQANNALKDLNKLNHLEVYGPDNSEFRLWDNPQLDNCSSICYWLENGITSDKLELKDNAYPCNSVQDILEVICDSLVSVEPELPEQALPLLLKMYPNPTDNSFFLELEGITAPEQVEIYSAAGQLVKSKTIANSNESVFINDLPSGIYFVRIKGRKGMGKIVIF